MIAPRSLPSRRSTWFTLPSSDAVSTVLVMPAPSTAAAPPSPAFLLPRSVISHQVNECMSCSLSRSITSACCSTSFSRSVPSAAQERTWDGVGPGTRSAQKMLWLWPVRTVPRSARPESGSDASHSLTVRSSEPETRIGVPATPAPHRSVLTQPPCSAKCGERPRFRMIDGSYPRLYELLRGRRHSLGEPPTSRWRSKCDAMPG
mmetsp:Transcript_7577/g.19377  ORF Transcript_7577/g.19377 Transcript_7577/m.19377 type:complete len:204 (+) Transcript_7577:168-779(+)